MSKALRGTVTSVTAGLMIVVAGACAPPARPGPPRPPTPIPPAPSFVTKAEWLMNETQGRTMHDTVAPAQNGTIGPAVVLTGGVYDFPGWKNNVGPGGILQGQIAVGDGEVAVPDSGHSLEPKNAIFKVSGVIRTRLTTGGVLPTGAPGTSFNVVQKSRAGDNGGFWKVEIGGSGPNRGRLLCTLGDGRQVVAVPSSVLIGDGATHSFACWLRGGVLVAEVDGHQVAAASFVDTIHPGGAFSTVVAIGKKPGSTDPSDSFSGWIGELRIAVG